MNGNDKIYALSDLIPRLTEYEFGWRTGRSGLFGEDKNLLILLIIEPRVVQSLA